MILTLAWRNIWRNKTRSAVIITAISLGIIAALSMDAFFQGMIRSYITDNVNKVTSHIQIHATGFVEDEDVNKYIHSSGDIMRLLDTNSLIKTASSRTVIQAMLSTSRNSRNVRVNGIHPVDEIQIRDLSKYIIEGEYLDTDKRNPIILSRKIAEHLKIKLGAKTVLTFQDMEGDVTAGLFRLAGVFHTGNNMFDEAHVFVRKSDLHQSMFPNQLNKESIDHEIAILLHDIENVDTVTASLSQQFPTLDVAAYKEIAPELGLYESQIDTMSTVYFTIVMLALIFGIINTMLMAVLERYKEFGVLMAIGLGKFKLFSLIMLETCLLCLAAAPVGLGLGYLIINYFSSAGIDMSIWAEFLEEYGMAPIIYPEVRFASFVRLTIFLIITAIIAAAYPGWKAIRLNPLEAIRKI
jgi:ABC-type lipoprotein release transport system permease subunit